MIIIYSKNCYIKFFYKLFEIFLSQKILISHLFTTLPPILVFLPALFIDFSVSPIIADFREALPSPLKRGGWNYACANIIKSV